MITPVLITSATTRLAKADTAVGPLVAFPHGVHTQA